MPRSSQQDETDRLKALAKTIVVSQGNQFIKELMRRHEIKIGTNKTDFLKNLDDAIDDGRLTQGDFEEWLDEVEGWGNQHVYFFAVPPRKSRAEILRLVQASASGAFVNVGRSHTFPESLTLTGIDVSNASVSFSWHRGTLTADRVEAKDKPNEEIEGYTYEFRAYRQRSNRAVMRFVWQFDLPYSAVFLQLSNEGHDHRDALGLVHEQLRQTGLALRPLARVPLSNAAMPSIRREPRGYGKSGRSCDRRESQCIDPTSACQRVRAAAPCLHRGSGRRKDCMVRFGALEDPLGLKLLNDVSHGLARLNTMVPRRRMREKVPQIDVADVDRSSVPRPCHDNYEPARNLSTPARADG